MFAKNLNFLSHKKSLSRNVLSSKMIPKSSIRFCSNFKNSSKTFAKLSFNNQIRFSSTTSENLLKNESTSPQPSPPLKPFSSMPSVPYTQLLQSLLLNNPHYPFEGWKSLNQQLGDTVHMNYLGLHLVLTFNPEDWPIIFRNTGKFPGPLQLLPWLQRERKKKEKDPNYEMNLLALEGQEWRDNRTILDQIFSSIPQIQTYIPKINLISDDFVDLLDDLLKTDQYDGKKLNELLYRYSNEVIGEVVYGYRLGGISSPSSPIISPISSKLSDDFFESLLSLFTTASELQYSLPIYFYLNTPKYQKFNELVDKIEEIGKEYKKSSDKYHEKIQNENLSYERLDLISHMRKKGQNEERININATTMFLAGSDSTTHTLSWLLYNLGRFPEIQEKLRKEIIEINSQEKFQKNSILALNEMKFLRATVKESMRLTPTAPGVSRILSTPVNVGGFDVPAGTMIIMMMFNSNANPDIFYDPLNFIPDRWLHNNNNNNHNNNSNKCVHHNNNNNDNNNNINNNNERGEEEKKKKANPFAHLPFGFGPRMCQAFRVAELEAYSLLSKLVVNFRWKTLKEAKPRVDLFIRPDDHLQLQFERIK